MRIRGALHRSLGFAGGSSSLGQVYRASETQITKLDDNDIVAGHAMMVTWSYSGRTVPSFDALLDQYSRSEFASPRRSTVPLLAYWRGAHRRLAEFSSSTGIPLSESVKLDFEHELPVQQGRGKLSCTDLMIVADGTAAALEAKFTEPRYEKVRLRLGQPPKQNRVDVLDGWLRLIGKRVGRRLDIDHMLDLPYQLIHRAASACHPDADSHWLVYQVFDVTPEKRRMYLDDLRSLADVIGETAGLRLCLVECALKRSDSYVQLEARWDAGHRDLHEPVLAGLRAGDLLELQLSNVIAI